MAYLILAATNVWPDEAPFTASGETGIKLRNRSAAPVRYVHNASRPADLDVDDGMVLDPWGEKDLTLKDGEGLWPAAPGLADGETVRVVLFY